MDYKHNAGRRELVLDGRIPSTYSSDTELSSCPAKLRQIQLLRLWSLWSASITAYRDVDLQVALV